MQVKKKGGVDRRRRKDGIANGWIRKQGKMKGNLRRDSRRPSKKLNPEGSKKLLY